MARCVAGLLDPDANRGAAFVALGENGEPIGFAEAALREGYVNDCDTSPVVFLERIYGERAMRGRGAGRALVDAVKA